MQELLKYESLANYDPTMEGARQFLKDHEKDENLQTVVKKLASDLRCAGGDRRVEDMLIYLIGVQRDSQVVLEKYHEQRNPKPAPEEYEAMPIFPKPQEPSLLEQSMSKLRTKSTIDMMSDRLKSKLNMFENIIYQNNPAGVPLAGGLLPPSPLQYQPNFYPPFTTHQQDRELDYLSGNLEIERDLQLVNFSTNFYTKYSLVYFGESEKEKATKLKIRVKLTNGKYVYLTRNELDDHSTKYRSIYSSYCALKRFIDRKEVLAFEDSYSINNFFGFRAENDDKMTIEAAPFKVLWYDPVTAKTKPDDGGTQYLKSKIFDSITVSMLKDHFDKDLGEDIILTFLCRKHYHFIDFMLRSIQSKARKDMPVDSGKKNTGPTVSSGAGKGQETTGK